MAALRCRARRFVRVGRQARSRVDWSLAGIVRTVEIAADVSVAVMIVGAMDVDAGISVMRSVGAVVKHPGRRGMSHRRWIRLRL